jgi:hypoxanthine phosphoribosyltransferase
VLTAAFLFTGDLVRCMEPCPRGTTVNFVRASSYGSGTASSGEVGGLRPAHVVPVAHIQF